MINHKKITILGGGIIGISNAIIFAERGFEVEVIAETYLWEKCNNPIFASLYPAASIIPHTVKGDTKRLFDTSKAVFAKLADTHSELVRWQLHFEINENKPLKKADYFAHMDKFQPFKNEIYQGFPIPKRDKNIPVFGHAFQMFFVEMEAYKQFLKQRIAILDIKITRRKLSANFFKTAPKGIYINALSFFGNQLVDDESSMISKAGILLRVKNQECLINKHFNQTISYNYTWGDELEVYAYSRNDSIILGGTRFELKHFENINTQIQNKIPSKYLKFNKGLPYPSYLIDVNKILLQQIYGVDLNIQDDDFEVLIGLRPVRTDGVNMETKEYKGCIILNSYGFGGAGVTLSWGCALENLRKVENLY